MFRSSLNYELICSLGLYVNSFKKHFIASSECMVVVSMNLVTEFSMCMVMISMNHWIVTVLIS